MPALLEREGFRNLLLGPPSSRQGNISTSTLAQSRADSPVGDLEATLARRLRSLHVTSRVWGQRSCCCGETTHMSRRMFQSEIGHVQKWTSAILWHWGFTSMSYLQRVQQVSNKESWTKWCFLFVQGSECLTGEAADGLNKKELWIMELYCPLMDKTGISKQLPGGRPMNPLLEAIEAAIWTFGFLKLIMQSGRKLAAVCLQQWFKFCTKCNFLFLF